MNYSIVTFGCRVNQADSLRLEQQLRAAGALESSAADADLVVVNTCSVTATADQGARQTIRRVARMNPSARIVVTGCYATRCADEVGALPGVVRVVRNDEKQDFIRFWMEGACSAPAGAERGTWVPASDGDRGGGGGSGPPSPRSGFGEVSPEPVSDAARAEADGAKPPREGGEGPCGAPIEPGVAGRTAFTLRVQTGCEERCAYCIIPSTRGASRSLPISDVVREVERAAGAGFKEIALTGVHLGSYGRDVIPRSSLVDLLVALENVKGDVQFRISSLEPMDCTEDVVEIVASTSRFLPHFHLPLQHASDRVLAAMRRPYTLADYQRLVSAIRTRMPDASIGSDMIVGFPGETDRDFAANCEYLPASPLTHLHVFPYSDRPGTDASTMTNKVDGNVIRARGARLREIGGALTRRFRESQLGSVRSGLTLEDGTIVVTDNYLKVRIDPGIPRNTRVQVRITSVASSSTVGVLEEARC